MSKYLEFREERRAPYAKLISWTNDVEGSVVFAWEQAKDPNFPQSVKGMREILSPSQIRERFRSILSDYSQCPEFASIAFMVYNCPRALLDQLVRHRQVSLLDPVTGAPLHRNGPASYFAQSLRVIDCSKFADQGNYFIPWSVWTNPTNDGIVRKTYTRSMFEAQETYKYLVKQGVPLEDARGVLPLHINTQVAVSVKVRDLVFVVQERMCEILQHEYWHPVLFSLRDELVENGLEGLTEIFVPPCERLKGAKCVSENEAFFRLEGKDPNKPCTRFPRWMEKNDRSIEVELEERKLSAAL